MNLDIFYFFNSFALQNPLLDKIIVFLATIFGVLLVLAVVFFLLFHQEKSIFTKEPFRGLKQRIVEIFMVFIAAAGAWVIASFIKALIGAPRPFRLLDEVNLLLDYGGFDSFPSGHASFFAALAMTLYFYHRKAGIIFFAGALLIGIARIIAGVHFPLDILVGYALGGLLAWVVYRLIKI